MSELDRFMRQLLQSRLADLHTALPGRITSIDGGRANVQPVERGMPLLTGLPMLKHTYRVTITGGDSAGEYACTGPHYEVGDLVLVGFAERALDGRGRRMHDLTDGVILGVISS